MSKRDGFLLELVYLAAGCAALGIVIAFAVVFACQYYSIDISRNLWILAIPVISSLALNICFIELYRKYGKKRPRR